jgi:CBS domain-containing protein
MSAITPPALLSLTADDLMTRTIVRIPERMSMRDAARLLLENQISGGPVVDDEGRCVGVLATTDFLPLARDPHPAAEPPGEPAPGCAFQRLKALADGTRAAVCTLPAGVCPLQAPRQGRNGRQVLVCRQPRGVLCDWQIMLVEQLPDDEVRRFMTADPVTARPTTSMQTLARRMIDAHIHRVVVLDAQQRPVGIVSSTDILAAVAYADGDQDLGGVP